MWTQQDGWNNLVPGISTLADAITKFGDYENQVKFVNAVMYEFIDRSIQVVVLNDQQPIYKIRIMSTFPDKDLMPKNIDDLQNVYGCLIKTNIDELATVTYEGSGLRATCSLFDKPQLVKWLEFYSDAN